MPPPCAKDGIKISITYNELSTNLNGMELGRRPTVDDFVAPFGVDIDCLGSEFADWKWKCSYYEEDEERDEDKWDPSGTIRKPKTTVNLNLVSRSLSASIAEYPLNVDLHVCFT